MIKFSFSVYNLPLLSVIRMHVLMYTYRIYYLHFPFSVVGNRNDVFFCKNTKQNKALWKALSYIDTHPQLLLYLSTIWHSFCGLSLEGSTLPQSYKLKHVFFKRGTV